MPIVLAAASMERRSSVQLQRRLSSWRRSLIPGSHRQINGDTSIPPTNKTMLQAFEWYTLSEGSYYRRLANGLPLLHTLGVTNIWIPPGAKASTPRSNGYDIYDPYDLGEFDQKGSRATKWGSKEELLHLCDAARREGVGIIWDAVLNHRAGADAQEHVLAVKCNPKNRLKEIAAPEEISAWTRFDYVGRRGKYSGKKYTAHDFNGTDRDASRNASAIYKFVGPGKKGWAEDVDNELGNYDYLMFANVDYTQPVVREDAIRWATWIVRELGLSGFRLDAMKHYSQDFQKQLVSKLDNLFGKEFFVVGEYFKADALALSKVIGQFSGRVHLFDVQLMYNFGDLSRMRPVPGGKADLRKVFEGSLLRLHPQRAVTFVANHDTQEFQSLAAPVEEWFVPHAYALILLRQDGLPCVFWGDLYGVNGPRPRRPAAGGRLARIMSAREKYAYGKQKDYFDEADSIGWTRSGSAGRNDGAGLAVVLNTGWEARWKKMYVGERHAGEKWTDIMGWAWGEVIIDDFGVGDFPVGPRGMAVWVRRDARGRGKIDKLTIDPPIDEKL